MRTVSSCNRTLLPPPPQTTDRLFFISVSERSQALFEERKRDVESIPESSSGCSG